MDLPNTLPPALERAVERLLAAVFRLLLKHGMSFTAFEALAKRVYVDVALREFGIPGKKPSIARASILSGLTRKEVQRLVHEDGSAPARAAVVQHENRAVRVLGAWTRDADFVDAQGRPRALEMQDGNASFAALVRRHSGDVPVRAVFDELLRVGAVRRRADGRVELVQQAFLPRTAGDKVDHLGSDVADLVRTIDHNIEHGDTDPRFQRRVMYHDMPRHVVDAFRKLSATQAMALLVKLDRWLADKAVAANAAPHSDPDQALVRLGMGIYYFEEDLERTDKTKE
jgi:Family of unknown function (DUF6502)